jgi:serine/threonine protein kinase
MISQLICNNSRNKYITNIECFDINGRGSAVIVMEAGVTDLLQSTKVGPIRGRNLRSLATYQISIMNLIKYLSRETVISMARATKQIHDAGLVWTDLKLSNFILVPKGNEFTDTDRSVVASGGVSPSSSLTCKAIDLESAVRPGESLRDFSPEVCAPELLAALTQGQMSILGGRGNDLKLSLQEPLIAHKALDIWALGISVLHLYSGM